jgi:hypothetical protein
VKPCLQEASEHGSADTLYVNFTSGTGVAAGFFSPIGLGSTPKDVADTVNPLMYDYIKGFQTKRYGIIPMDFPEMPNNKGLLKKLVELNRFIPFVRNDLNGKRVRNPSTGAVYLIIDGARHHIPSMAIANRLFGSEWGVDQFYNADAFAEAYALEDANLLKFRDNGEDVYLSFKIRGESHAVMRKIPNMQLLNEYGLRGAITMLPREDYAKYVVKQPLPAPGAFA